MDKTQSKHKSSSSGSIARSAGAVSIAVLCSRVLGLVREQIFAGMFGAGYAYDAFLVAFRIPNLLRDLFGEGALSAAFVIVFTDYDVNRGPRETWRLAGNVLCFFALLLSCISLVGIIAAPWILGILAPDFAAIPGKTELTTGLTRIMMPFLLFISLSAVVMGMLNAKGHFFVPAMASSFFNLGSIIGGVGLALLAPRYGLPPIGGMAVGTLIGGLMQLCCQIPALGKIGFRFRPRLDLADPGLRRILGLMLPALIGLSATQINIFVNTSFAASCAEGSVSWLNYAFRLVQLPIGLFGVALSVAVMPVLARHAAQHDLESLKQTYITSLIMVFSLSLPATAGLYLLAEPVIRLIFEHGAFTALDTRASSEALQFYALGLFAYSAVKVTVPAFYALNNTRFPVFGSFLAVTANICIINIFIDAFQHRAIALSTSCAMAINFFFLFFVLRRQLPGLELKTLGLALVKIIQASTLMALVLAGLKLLLHSWINGSLPAQLFAVGLMVVLGAGSYALVLHLLRLPELTMISNKVLGRLRSS